MIKRFGFLTLLVGLLGFAFFLNSKARESEAQQPVYQCPGNIQSTQARVQNNIQTPWSQNITVGCERAFNVGSFHNNSGVFATDTVLQVVGPNNYNAYFKNGDRVVVPNDGVYTLAVTTINQNDPARCSGQATVTVSCSTPPTSSCRYGSTQARVQLNDQSPWTKQLNLTCGQIFEVGSFHDGNGSAFATDTQLRVIGPSIAGFAHLDHLFTNDAKVRAYLPGRYTLYVTTPGQTGPACEETAVVDTTCGEWWRVN